MPKVVAFEDVKVHQFKGGNRSLTTPFLKSSRGTPHLPVAFLSESEAGRVIRTHYHIVDEFQIITHGAGKLGRHNIAPYCVHFARAYTPYGPLECGDENTVSFFTLRARSHPEVFYLPEAKEQLKQTPNRHPWQITSHISFSPPDAANKISLQEIPDMKDARGLGTYSLTMSPNTKTVAPTPASGGGQYTLVVKGSLWHDNKEHRAFTVAFLEPDEAPFALQAGRDGLQAIIMNFPRPLATPA